MKFDIIMWTFNGEKFFPKVLQRIEEVIPKEYVHRKIIVDDHSTDNTVTIAKSYNWNVYFNPSTGIPSGANEALKHVDCKYFLAFEQDLVLAYNWGERIPKLLDNSDVAAAQGVRYATNPILNKIDNYYASKMTFREPISIVDAPSIDNTLFKTDIVRSIGGFPTECPLCSDTILLKKLAHLGYKWLVDTCVISGHIKPSIRYNYDHVYFALNRCALTPLCSNNEKPRRLNGRLLAFLKSPIRALIIGFRMKEPRILLVYPLEKWHYVNATSKLYRIRYGGYDR